MRELGFHPIAECLPLLDGDEFEELKRDIEEHGQRVPIVLYEGKILDGRNRYRACQELGIEPKTAEFKEDNPWRYVWSLNGARRHFRSREQQFGCWKQLDEGAAEYERIEREVKEERKRKQSKATKRRERRRDGTLAASSASNRGGTGRDHTAEKETKTATAKAKASGTNRPAVERYEMIERKRPDLAEKVRRGEMAASSAIREIKREETRSRLEKLASLEVPRPDRKYDVIVIDPPWPMQKIERDCRPNQVAFDYPTMSVDEIAALEMPTADDCHVWIWATQKFLPAALRCASGWGLKYVCTFVWHKPGGPQPMGLPQYNCEFAVYCRRGSPDFIDTKAFPTAFSAPRGAHSEKPEEFYEVIRRVTAGRRLDMFNRRAIEGFEGWGNEAVAA